MHKALAPPAIEADIVHGVAADPQLGVRVARQPRRHGQHRQPLLGQVVKVAAAHRNVLEHLVNVGVKMLGKRQAAIRLLLHVIGHLQHLVVLDVVPCHHFAN